MILIAPLPGLHVAWTAYAGDAPFVSYTVERREVRTLLDGHAPLTVQIEDDGRILLAAADVLSGIRGAVAMRLDFGWDNASEPGSGTGTPTFLNYQQDSSNLIRGYYDEATDSLKLLRTTPTTSSTATVAQAITAGAHTLVLAWDADTLYVSFDGAAFTSAASTPGAEIDIDVADIGSRQGFDDAEAEVLWLLTFADVPTTDELEAIHALGDEAPYVDALRDVVQAQPRALWVGGAAAGIKAVVDDWTAVATIDDASRAEYDDYRPNSGRRYEYAARVTANVFGEPITSDRQDPPVDGVVQWRGVAVHNVIDPAAYMLLPSRETAVEPDQDKEYVQARGRRERTPQYGERRDRRISVKPVVAGIEDNLEWERIERFFAAQQDTAAVFLVRPGHRPEGWFAVIDDAARRDVLVLGQSDLVFQQVHYDESAG